MTATMVQLITPPDPRGLLPPLLACLPTAFASPRPPPALLPLLSPILRQRVQLLSATNSSSESWLPLLCWDAQKGSKLPELVEGVQLEPHPVSGEIEIEDVEEIRYRRLDQETLHSRLELEEFDLLALYLWCTSDPLDGSSGWRLSELKALRDKEDGTKWFSSISEADECYRQGIAKEDLSRTNGVKGVNGANGANGVLAATNPGEDDDDDDYWAAYDRTPGRTPAKRSPAPKTNTAVQPPTTTELEYFARYMAEVQPAMDPHDPSEETLAPGESTLDGNELVGTLARTQTEPLETSNIGASGFDSSLPLQETELSHPRPRSSSPSSMADSVGKLEKKADTLSHAEVGIKQHISTDIKSLFRLARSAGIEREEFERIVRTELDVLGMMDMDE